MFRPDIRVTTSDNRLLLIAEVKGKRGASSDWVKQMRQLLLASDIIPKSPYFLLALPDYFYLWKNPSSENAEPDYKIEAKQALAAYLESASLSLEKISGEGLELLVSSWLRDLTYLDDSKERDNPSMKWLFESGLYDEIKNGKVLLEAAA
jgi:hypothetical protein